MAKTPKKKVAGASKRPAKTDKSAASDRIPVKEAAELLMITPRRIQQLVAEGYIPASVGGRYDLAATVQGYIRSLTDERKSQSQNQHANELRDTRKRKLEIEIAKDDRRLIELEEHDAVVDELVGMVREEFGALPAQISREPGRRREIEDKVNAILGKLSARAEKRGAELRAAGAIAEAVGEDDAG